MDGNQEQANKPLANKPAASASAGKTVELADTRGQKLGITVQVSDGPARPADDETGIRTAAERVKGWNDFEVEGEAYPYTPDNVLALFNRFPHFAKQVLGE